MKLQVVALIISIFCSFIDAANILGIWPAVRKSHFTLGLALIEKLAENGHTITFISPYEYREYETNPNIKFVKLDGAVEVDRARHPGNSLEIRNLSAHQSLMDFIETGKEITDFAMSHVNLLSVLFSEEKFDLLLLDHYSNDAILGVAYFLKIPVITFSSAGSTWWSDDIVKNPLNPAYNPNKLLGFTDEMHFCQRLRNSAAYIVDQFNYYFYYLPAQEELFAKHFDGIIEKPMPKLSDLIHNVDLVLLNSHPVLQYPKAHVPNSVEVGGMHLRNLDDLIHPEFHGIMDKAVNGIIYFSMGSSLRSSDFPEEVLDAFVKVFQSMENILVLWKFESATLKEKHAHNVIIGPWMPQQEILKHKNLKVFITHGGLLSTMEALNYGKPIIGIPIDNDQKFNMARAVKQGYGITLNFDKLTENSIKNAIDAIFNNSTFQQNAEKFSELFKDTPMKPIDKAAYYVEHVIRMNGAKHLRTAATKLSFWQIHLIDQLIFILVLITSITSITVFALSKAMKFISMKIQKRKKLRSSKSSTRRNKFKSN